MYLNVIDAIIGMRSCIQRGKLHQLNIVTIAIHKNTNKSDIRHPLFPRLCIGRWFPSCPKFLVYLF
jgi:hypothetical protein